MSKDIAGQRFGRLTAIERTGEKRWGVYLWRCACDCGSAHVAAVNSLRSGLVRSCGCLLREVATAKAMRHGMFGTTEYRIWSGMIQRCTNPKNNRYELYGARGVRVCKRWETFDNFYADMGPRPRGLTLDRKDPSGNYEPGNCRWASTLLQRRNRRDRTTTFEEAEQVRVLRAQGLGCKAISEELNLTRGSVNGIVYLGTLSRQTPEALARCQGTPVPSE